MTSAKVLCCLLFIIGVSIHTTVSQSQPQSRKQLRERQNVKTIKTRHGQIYDCVDFYDQPAFKHPQLKNHAFYPMMKPTNVPDTIITRNDTTTSKLYISKNVGCPSRTVPIKRLSKEDRFRATMFLKPRAYGQKNGPISPPGTHFAILQTRVGPSPPNYYGVGAIMSVWNPQVKENQYSAGQFTIQNGLESLQVGWMVNPTMYKDNLTHMFIHTNAGESHCYNTYCPGFVIVQPDVPPDIAYDQHSKQGKRSVVSEFFIYRETSSGNWWLLVSPDKIPIGFWPAKIFSTLNKFGTYISCGGEVYSPPDQSGGYPPMGSGEFPLNLPDQDAFASHFVMANEKLTILNVEDTEKFMDTKKYIVDDLGIRKSGHVLYYGGYGG